MPLPYPTGCCLACPPPPTPTRLARKPGAELDCVDCWGLAPLHYAAALGHSSCVEVLWPQGASIEAVDTQVCVWCVCGGGRGASIEDVEMWGEHVDGHA